MMGKCIWFSFRDSMKYAACIAVYFFLLHGVWISAISTICAVCSIWSISKRVYPHSIEAHNTGIWVDVGRGAGYRYEELKYVRYYEYFGGLIIISTGDKVVYLWYLYPGFDSVYDKLLEFGIISFS